MHEIYEIRRDYDASTSAAKDGDLQMIMDELDHLMRLVQFNPREGDSHDQFQKTYGYLVERQGIRGGVRRRFHHACSEIWYNLRVLTR